MTRFVIGRFAAYGSALAEIGVTVFAPLPCCRKAITTTAITITAAAAIANGIQFRSCASLECTSFGPLFTSGFYTPCRNPERNRPLHTLPPSPTKSRQNATRIFSSPVFIEQVNCRGGIQDK